MKKNNKKGFTLAELLIVVAIIAVLVAIAIPVFNTQLEKSREATDLANVRSAYAELLAAALTGESSMTDTNIVKYTVSGTTYTAEVQLKQAVSGWANADAPSAVAGIVATGTPSKGGKGTITYDADTGTVTIAYA